MASVSGGWNNIPGTKIMLLKVADNIGVLSQFIDDAIIWAAQHGAKVINMSFSLTTNTIPVSNAINYAYDYYGAVLVASSGNFSNPPVCFPASHDKVLAVGGIDIFWRNEGNNGPLLDVVAPSWNLFSFNGNNYEYVGGTSFSAPLVSSLAALIYSYLPYSINHDVINLIKNEAYYDTRMINNPDLFGKGLINCVGSLTSLHIANQPKNLILTNYNSHPKLTWDTNIPTLANNINDFSKYRILRSLENQYNYVNVGEVVYDHTLQTHTWTDNSIIIRKGPLKVYYRVVLVMSDDEESITSNEVSAPIGYPSKKFSTSKIDYSLTQNYPNPFNPTTTISYSLPLSGFTTLKIYDILTNEVATLVNEDKLAGSYVVEFNASNLSSGVYFYNLTSGSYSINKKMILMK